MDDRRFMLADAARTRLRSSRATWSVTLRAEYDPRRELLQVSLSDGRTFSGDARTRGEMFSVDVHGRSVEGQIISGAWDEGLAALAGRKVSLLRTAKPGQYQVAPITLLSQASIAELEKHAGHAVDARRFRMTLLLTGCEPHEEDGWQGRLVECGQAVLRIGSGVPRCAVTNCHPETGVRDLDTLAILARYRTSVADGGIPFGVYATVEKPGCASAILCARCDRPCCAATIILAWEEPTAPVRRRCC